MAERKVMYLLDTNIISEPFRVNPNETVVRRLRDCSESCAISSITWHELHYGLGLLKSERKKRELAEYIRLVVSPNYPIFSYDEKAAKLHGELRASLQLTGNVRPILDFQIAAIALSRDLTLVTRNVADFSGIPNLRLENWFC